MDSISAKPLSVWRRFYGVLFNPVPSFAEIISKPNWGLALCVITIINAALTLVTLPKLKVFMLETIQQQAQQNPALNTPQGLDVAMTSGVIAAVAGAILAPAFGCLIYALLLKIFNMFTGEKAPFRRFYAVTVYAYVPLLFSLLIQTVVVLLSAHPDFTSSASSLYAFFPAGASGFAANLAKQVEPFFLWSLCLMALGSSALMRKPMRTTAIYIFILWVVYAVFMASRMPALS
jgi:hypothetical protein